MKIYIDKNLTPRYSPTGWPEKPVISAAHIYEDQADAYDKALAKAKADSFTFESVRELDDLLKGQGLIFTKDTFIAVEIGEVELYVGGLGVVTLAKDHQGNNSIWVEWAGGRTNVIRSQIYARVKKQENAVMGYSEGSEIPQMPAEEKQWREQQIEVDKKIYDDENRLFAVLKSSLIEADVAPIDVDEIASLMMPDVKEFIRQQLAAANKRIEELEEFVAVVKSMRVSQDFAVSPSECREKYSLQRYVDDLVKSYESK